ncbi:MAG: alpha/beta hydrolase, partial [Enterococcus viikkiensis]
EKTFAAGLSMGGYGALKHGLAKPEHNAAVASLSGAVIKADRKSLLLVRNEAYWQGIFGPLDQIQGSANDPLRLLDELVASGQEAPRFFLACGTEDDLYPASQYIAHKLEQKNLTVTFEEGPGKHDWVFWDAWIQRVLAWFNEQ